MQGWLLYKGKTFKTMRRGAILKKTNKKLNANQKWKNENICEESWHNGVAPLESRNIQNDL